MTPTPDPNDTDDAPDSWPADLDSGLRDPLTLANCIARIERDWADQKRRDAARSKCDALEASALSGDWPETHLAAKVSVLRAGIGASGALDAAEVELGRIAIQLDRWHRKDPVHREKIALVRETYERFAHDGGYPSFKQFCRAVYRERDRGFGPGRAGNDNATNKAFSDAETIAREWGDDTSGTKADLDVKPRGIRSTRSGVE